MGWRTEILVLVRAQILFSGPSPETPGAHTTSYQMNKGGGLSPRLKRPGRKVLHSPPTSSEVENWCSYTSTSLHIFHGLLLNYVQGQLYNLYLYKIWIREWRPIGLWDVEAPTFCLCSRLTNCGKNVSPTRRPPYTPAERFLVLISVRSCVDTRAIVGLEGLGKLKKKITSSGLHPVTFRLVAQCLNQLRYRVAPKFPFLCFFIYRLRHENV
jgi:hypothetical protein